MQVLGLAGCSLGERDRVLRRLDSDGGVGAPVGTGGAMHVCSIKHHLSEELKSWLIGGLKAIVLVRTCCCGREGGSPAEVYREPEQEPQLRPS